MSDHPDRAQTANLAMSAAQALSGFAAAVYAGGPATPLDLAPADAIGKLLDALVDLAGALASPGATETFPQSAPLLLDAAEQISIATNTLDAAERVEAQGRYVVARIKKAYEPGGERPGPQHVGKTFVPFDDSTFTKAAAEERAGFLNGGYRFGPDGKTFIAVRAEPIPGTDKFRNLDHPSLAGKAKTSADATQERRNSAAPGLGEDEPAAAARVVELDGKTVPLADCDWVEWAPCGCPVGTAAGRNVATEGDAWKDFYPREADRERAQKQGYRWELMTHDRWSAEVADLMIAGCPHAGPAAETGAGRVTSRDRPAVPALVVAGFPHGPAAGLRPDKGAGTSSGRSAHGTARRPADQSPRAIRGPR